MLQKTTLKLSISVLLLILGSILLVVVANHTSFDPASISTTSSAISCDGCHSSSIPFSKLDIASVAYQKRQTESCDICYKVEPDRLLLQNSPQTLQSKTLVVGQDLFDFYRSTAKVYHQDTRFAFALQHYQQAVVVLRRPDLSDAEMANANTLLDQAAHALAELENEITSGFWTTASSGQRVSIAAVLQGKTSTKSVSSLNRFIVQIDMTLSDIHALADIKDGGFFVIALCIIFAVLSYCIPDDSMKFNFCFGYNRRLMLMMAQPPFLFVLLSCTLTTSLLSCAFWTSSAIHRRISGTERAFYIVSEHQYSEAPLNKNNMTLNANSFVFERRLT